MKEYSYSVWDKTRVLIKKFVLFLFRINFGNCRNVYDIRYIIAAWLSFLCFLEEEKLLIERVSTLKEVM